MAYYFFFFPTNILLAKNLKIGWKLYSGASSWFLIHKVLERFLAFLVSCWNDYHFTAGNRNLASETKQEFALPGAWMDHHGVPAHLTPNPHGVAQLPVLPTHVLYWVSSLLVCSFHLSRVRSYPLLLPKAHSAALRRCQLWMWVAFLLKKKKVVDLPYIAFILWRGINRATMLCPVNEPV